MIYILGAGAMATDVFDIYIDLGKESEVAGFLEENCQREKALLLGKEINDVSILKDLNRDTVKLICGIGTPLRKRLVEYTKDLGFRYDTAIHPSVLQSRFLTLGEGIISAANDIIKSQVTIGNHTLILSTSIVGHGVHIGEFTTVSSGVLIGGNSRIGNNCFIGMGTVIIQQISVGNNSFIGAGSVVTRDIPDNVLAVGVPAKPIREITESDWKELI